MPDPSALLAAAATVPDATIRTLAAATGLPKSSVHEALARFGPVKETLGQIKRDEFTAAWQAVAIKSVAAMDQFLDGEEPIPVGAKSSVSAEIRNLAVAAGIASEKALLFAGQPTQITAQTHEHRLALPERVALLASLAERMARLAGSSAPQTPALAQGLGTSGPIIEADSGRRG